MPAICLQNLINSDFGFLSRGLSFTFIFVLTPDKILLQEWAIWKVILGIHLTHISII